MSTGIGEAAAEGRGPANSGAFSTPDHLDREDLKAAACARLVEARCLLEAGHYAGAILLRACEKIPH